MIRSPSLRFQSAFSTRLAKHTACSAGATGACAAAPALPAARPPLVVAAVVVAEEFVTVALVAAARAAVRLLPARVGAAAGARAAARCGVPAVGARELAGVGPARRRTPLRPPLETSASTASLCCCEHGLCTRLAAAGPALSTCASQRMQAPPIHGVQPASSIHRGNSSAWRPAPNRAAAPGARAVPGRLGAVRGGPGARGRPRSLRLQVQVQLAPLDRAAQHRVRRADHLEQPVGRAAHALARLRALG